MISSPQTNKDYREKNTNNQSSETPSDEKILCLHCKRTASNGIKCKGICVADDGY